MPRLTIWSDPARAEQLKALWLSGKTYAECADAMGCFGHCEDGGIKAVSAKIHRLGLGRNLPSPWTDERFALLTKYYPALSMQEIADRINAETGSAFDRNSIASKIYNSGITVRRRPKGGGEYKPRPNRYAGAMASAAIANVQNRIVFNRDGPSVRADNAFKKYERNRPAHFIGIPFAETTDASCMFPLGDKPMLFCGQPRMKDSAYCPGCHVRCWKPKGAAQ